MDIAACSPPIPGLCNPALSANVLVLNKFYQAIRVVNVKRAFSLLAKDQAEVVHIETDTAGQAIWQNLDLTEWTELLLRGTAERAYRI